MFEVFENNKPCVVDIQTWRNNKFDSFEKALEYAKNWSGSQSCFIPKDWCGKPIDISMCEYPVILEIRKS